MQRMINTIIYLLVLAVVTYCQTDPCTQTDSIPDIHRRDAAYELSSEESSINDRELIEGWYGDRTLSLINHAPGFFHCGGWYPIWRSATDASGQTATMCIQTQSAPCAQSFDIEMKRCNGFEVYKLLKGPFHRTSYCFDMDPAVRPNFNVKPTITVNLHHDTVTKLLFRCNFIKSSENLFYRTIWHVNGSPVYTFEAMQWTSDYISETTLTEDLLADNNITKAGFNLRCLVRAQYNPSSSPSESQLSDNKFVGVKIHPWDTQYVNEYVMKEGETRKLDVSLTVPFGCGTIPLKLCVFNIEVVTLENSEDCEVAAVTEGSCGIKPIRAEQWRQQSHLTFVGRITRPYGQSSSTVHLKLKTPGSIPELSPFWQDVEIGSLPIQITKDTSLVKHKYCYSRNDPYERTFGGRSYYLDKTGIYTMYDDNKNIEVQIQTEVCSRSVDDGPFCTCGVAVRAGRTVFEISHCESPIWHIGYTACGDGGDVLNVMKSRFNKYIITLHNGVVLQVTADSAEPYRVNVYLYPSVSDAGESRGLCGVLSSSALRKKDGTDTSSTDDFAESWSVSEDNSLFNPDVIENGFASFTPVYQFCTCDESNRDNLAVTCSSRTVECNKPKGYDTVTPKSCTVSKRKKRMALYQPRLMKRQATTPQTWFNGWNQSSATAFCESKFAESSSVQMLKDIPGVDVDGVMKDCVEDIKKSGSTVFASMAISDVRFMALHESMVNPALSATNTSNPSAPTMFDTITLLTCDGDCSGRGSCTQGECNCNAGYGGSDCSIDLATPPVILDTEDGDHCDRASRDCLQLGVLGRVFSGEENAKCRIQKNKIKSTGETERGNVSSSAAVSESISEVECTLPEADPAEAVTAYVISVSHAGDVYSNEITVLVYDSTCVTVNTETRAWRVQNGYCIYKGKCSIVGDSRIDNPSVKCVNTNGVSSWNTTTDGSSSASPYSDTTTSTTTSKQATVSTASKQTALTTGSNLTTLLSASEQTTLPTASEQSTLPSVSKQTTLPPASELTTLPTASEQTTHPTASKQTTLPTSSKETTLSTASEQTTLSTASKQTALPTVSIQTTPTTTSKQTALPTVSEQTTPTSTSKQTNLSTASKQTALPTVSEQTTLTTASKQTTLSTASKQTALPTESIQTTPTTTSKPKTLPTAFEETTLTTASEQRNSTSASEQTTVNVIVDGRSETTNPKCAVPALTTSTFTTFLITAVTMVLQY